MARLPDPIAPDPIVDADLDAYVDEQLDVRRRIEVEAHLASRPAEAARVMSDLRSRDELRLAMAASVMPGALRTAEAARRLERALSRRRFTAAVRRIAALGLFVGVGWLAHAELGPLGVREVAASPPPPAFVSGAVSAHRTSLLRAGMDSQPETRAYDPAEILSATAIVMPPLPQDWSVEDVQVFPSAFGPSVEITLDAGNLGTLSLFAVRPGRFDVTEPRLASEDETVAAFWQVGEVGYALVTNQGERGALDTAAVTLARSLY